MICSPSPTEGYDPAQHLPAGHSTGQHVLDLHTTDEREAQLRQHVAGLIVDLVDTRLSREVRVDSLRHLVSCDPARGFALMAQMVTSSFETSEQAWDLPPGSNVEALREVIRNGGPA